MTRWDEMISSLSPSRASFLPPLTRLPSPSLSSPLRWRTRATRTTPGRRKTPRDPRDCPRRGRRTDDGRPRTTVDATDGRTDGCSGFF
eukprot:30078-Pelagococcus_subviridis.AAC.4